MQMFPIRTLARRPPISASLRSRPMALALLAATGRTARSPQFRALAATARRLGDRAVAAITDGNRRHPSLFTSSADPAAARSTPPKATTRAPRARLDSCSRRARRRRSAAHLKARAPPAVTPRPRLPRSSASWRRPGRGSGRWRGGSRRSRPRPTPAGAKCGMIRTGGRWSWWASTAMRVVA
jgi:hypothetical protein